MLGSGILLAVKTRSSERSEAERVCSNSDGFAFGVSSSASQENLRASRSFAKTGFWGFAQFDVFVRFLGETGPNGFLDLLASFLQDKLLNIEG